MVKKSSIWNWNYTCIFLANMAQVFSQFLVNPLITTYAAWLGAGTTIVGMLTGLYFAVAVLMRPVSGPAITVLDHRKLLVATYSVGVVVNLMYALCPTIGLFIAARVLHGIEFSFLGSLLMVMAGESLPPEKLGAGLGMFSLGSAVGTAIGPTVGLAMRTLGQRVFADEGGGYRMAFFAAGAVMLLALIPCCLCREMGAPQVRSEQKKGKWYSNIIAVESIVPALMLTLVCMSNNLYTAYLVPYSEEKGFAGISLFFTVYAIAMLLTRPLVNRMIERHGALKVILPGLGVYALSFLTVSLAGSILMVYFASILAAIGYSMAFPSMQALAMEMAPLEKRGAASNTAFLGQDLGFFLGPALGGFVLSALELSGHAYSSLYLFGIIPLVLGILLCFAQIRKASKKVGA